MRRQQNVLSMWSSSATFGWISSSKLDRWAKRGGGCLPLEQDQINTEHSGIIEMNEKIVINPIKPDSILSAWSAHTNNQRSCSKQQIVYFEERKNHKNRLANKMVAYKKKG